jgi:hypothetical protein
MPHFECGAFNHSATSPAPITINISRPIQQKNPAPPVRAPRSNSRRRRSQQRAHGADQAAMACCVAQRIATARIGYHLRQHRRGVVLLRANASRAVLVACRIRDYLMGDRAECS